MITIGISFIVKSFKPLNIYLYNRLLEMRLVLFAVIIFMEIVDWTLHLHLHEVHWNPYLKSTAVLISYTTISSKQCSLSFTKWTFYLILS